MKTFGTKLDAWNYSIANGGFVYETANPSVWIWVPADEIEFANATEWFLVS